MKLGATDITDIKLGTVDITKAMLGTDEIWSATPPALSYVDWLKSLAPVLFYRMADDDTSMVDEMGNVNGTHGTASVVAAPIPTAAGAHSYNGSHHSTLVSPSALASTAFTTAMWLQVPSGAPTDRSIFNGFAGTAFTQGHQFWFSAQNGGTLVGYRGNNTTASALFASVLPRDTPVRVVMTHASNTTTIYVNGTSAASTGFVNYTPSPAGNTWEIGSENGSAYFQGLVWDVAFFDYAWDAATAEEDYERGTEGME